MDITIIGDEIFANGNKVATIEATTASLVGDFKEWINDQNENQTLEMKISDLEVLNDKLTDEIDETKEDHNDLLDELEELKARIEKVISDYGDRH